MILNQPQAYASNDPNSYLEVIHPNSHRGGFECVLFDFDGTLSLIRRGWREIMVPFFAEAILSCPDSPPKEIVEAQVREFVSRLTGKQTIYQCLQLADTITSYGGVPVDPLIYKKEYLARLWSRIENSFNKLKEKILTPDELLLRGSRTFLNRLQEKGMKLYLASGTDQINVLEEASALGLNVFFEDRIFGAKDNWKEFSKNMIISKIMEENSLQGKKLLVVGDGYVEIEEGKTAGGFALGVASDEMKVGGMDAWKRKRLIDAGADAIITDYADTNAIMRFLFP